MRSPVRLIARGSATEPSRLAAAAPCSLCLACLSCAPSTIACKSGVTLSLTVSCVALHSDTWSQYFPDPGRASGQFVAKFNVLLFRGSGRTGSGGHPVWHAAFKGAQWPLTTQRPGASQQLLVKWCCKQGTAAWAIHADSTTAPTRRDNCAPAEPLPSPPQTGLLRLAPCCPRSATAPGFGAA